MEHNPFITMSDETEITRSDLKLDNTGKEYITIYFETPTEKGFSSMEINYPNGIPTNIIGYSENEVSQLLFHYNKIAELAFDEAKGSFRAED